jgi:NitT/TauT family transport system substrate-binding protein
MEEYKKSASYVNENVDAAAQLVEDFDIFKAAVAKKAIPYCNITFVTGSEMKTKVTNYLNVLYQANPDSIGGKMPADDFYIQ